MIIVSSQNTLLVLVLISDIFSFFSGNERICEDLRLHSAGSGVVRLWSLYSGANCMQSEYIGYLVDWEGEMWICLCIQTENQKR